MIELRLYTWLCETQHNIEFASKFQIRLQRWAFWLCSNVAKKTPKPFIKDMALYAQLNWKQTEWVKVSYSSFDGITVQLE